MHNEVIWKFDIPDGIGMENNGVWTSVTSLQVEGLLSYGFQEFGGNPARCLMGKEEACA